MIKNKKLSLSFINSFLFILFISILFVGISISIYFTMQKVIDYNIGQYSEQTNNITKIILESEQKILNEISLEIANVIHNSNYKTKNLDTIIDSIVATDNIDLLFLEENKKIIDYSNSLFDTQAIIQKIRSSKISVDNAILALKIHGENYVVLLSIKKIINKETGRVIGKLYTGKLLNDNFLIINNIKKKAALEDLHMYFDGNLIASTSNKKVLDLSLFSNEDIIKKGEYLYLIKKEKIHDSKELDVVFVAKNTTFELLKDDFLKIGYFLFVFIILLFMTLYSLTNKFIINPFSELLDFAKKAKDEKYATYKNSNVLEFDNFSIDLKSIIDELRDLKEQYSRAIEGVEDGLWDYDLKKRKIFYSNRFINMLGYTKDDNIKNFKFWKNSVHKDDYFKTLRKLFKHIKSKTNLYEDKYRFLCKDGSYKWIHVRGKAFFNEKGQLIRLTGFHTDIDEFITLQNDNIKKEKMLYQQNKLASMGEMIGNIAHQWRQPLNVISTISSSQIIKLEMGLSKEEEILEDLNKLNDTVQYLSSIIDKFRYFFNPNKELEEFYIDDTINENLKIFESTYNSEGINLIISLKNIKIIGYRFELMQVIINIINNSKDAFNNSNIKDKKYVFLDTKKENDFIIIKIYDNAGGINEKIKNKIYEPYFTTKHQSQGTGLGLYMSSEIIKKHFKGQLSNETIEFKYEGEEYKGEEFTIVLPQSK